MTQAEIKGHEALKAKFPNYPKLPKFIIKGVKTTAKNKGHHDSCLRGFYTRVKNWSNAEEQRISL